MRNSLIGLAFIGLSLPVFAGTSPLFATSITKIMTDNVNYGGCMAKLAKNPATVAGVNCKPDWVSFGCSGEYYAKDVAARGFAAAQLALVTGNKITIRITDNSVYNKGNSSAGYCTVQRIDNDSQ